MVVRGVVVGGMDGGVDVGPPGLVFMCSVQIYYECEE